MNVSKPPFNLLQENFLNGSQNVLQNRFFQSFSFPLNFPLNHLSQDNLKKRPADYSTNTELFTVDPTKKIKPDPFGSLVNTVNFNGDGLLRSDPIMHKLMFLNNASNMTNLNSHNMTSLFNNLVAANLSQSQKITSKMNEVVQKTNAINVEEDLDEDCLIIESLADKPNKKSLVNNNSQPLVLAPNYNQKPINLNKGFINPVETNTNQYLLDMIKRKNMSQQFSAGLNGLQGTNFNNFHHQNINYLTLDQAQEMRNRLILQHKQALQKKQEIILIDDEESSSEQSDNSEFNQLDSVSLHIEQESISNSNLLNNYHNRNPYVYEEKDGKNRDFEHSLKYMRRYSKHINETEVKESKKGSYSAIDTMDSFEEQNEGESEIIETMVGSEFQATIPTFNLNKKNKTRRNVKIRWDPNYVDREELEKYFETLEKKTEQVITNEETKLDFLNDFKMNIEKALEQVDSDIIFYKRFFKLIRRRGRRSK